MGNDLGSEEGAQQGLELVLDARSELGEGPVWDASDQALFWVDIFAGVLHRLDTRTSTDTAFDLGEIVGCVVPRTNGKLLVATQSGVYEFDSDSQQKTRVSDVESNRPETHFNDGKVDPAGRFWFGSIAIDRTKDILGDLYSLETDLTVTKRLSGVDNTNGMAWNADKRKMYFIDSLTRQVTEYDYDPEHGAIEHPRPAVTLPEGTGVPDGMTIDLDGNLWVAHWGGGRVTRWDPETGDLLQTVPVPANLTTSCAFGGPELDRLYITTARYGETVSVLERQPHAGGVFSFQTDTRGTAVAVFPG